MPHKNNSLFHINACSLNKNLDDLQHLLRCTQMNFDIIAKNFNDYSFKFTPKETSTGGTLLYIANHLSCKCRNDLNISKKK